MFAGHQDPGLAGAIVQHQRSINIITVKVRPVNQRKTSIPPLTRPDTKKHTNPVNVSTDPVAGVTPHRPPIIGPVIRKGQRIRRGTIKTEFIRKTRTVIIPRIDIPGNTGTVIPVQ